MSRMSGARALRATLAIAGLSLACFHGWLLALQISGGELADPWVIFRWLAAAFLVAALVAVRRNGDSIWGRKGIAIWVLAGLLHGPAAATGADFTSLALPENVATVVLQFVSSSALAIGLWILAGLLAPRRAVTQGLRSFAPAFAAAGCLDAALSPHFAPRPPPLRG